MKYILILDTSVIIAFFKEAEYPELLNKISQLGFEIYITSHVASELRNPSLLEIRSIVRNLRTVDIDDECISEIRRFCHGLTETDLSIICYLMVNDEAIAVVDDELLRKCILKFLSPDRVHGTLWLIKDVGVKKGLISANEAKKLVEVLKKRGFRVPKNFKID